ncbi:Alpha/Beta hydrolase protein [Mycena polygramma]|nr:Alpha/Beta hydrolase protein [Mycena polygramma]KAJ7620833.1 Alpha/Beta hydrolase protein [Mycena polygramma]
MSQYSHLSKPTPELVALLSTATLPDFSGISPADLPALREQVHVGAVPGMLERYRARLPPDSTYAVQNHKLAVEGGEIDVRVLTPTSGESTATFPVLVWFHGGGFVFGNLDFDDFQLRILCVERQIVIVNVDYRLAPEHPFPVGVNDSYAALKWTLENASKFGGSLEKGFVVGGLSAGANLTAVTVHRALKDPLFAASGQKSIITGQLLQVPMLLHHEAYPPEYKTELLSYVQNKNAPSLNGQMAELFLKCYAGPATHPDLSPLLAITSDQALAPPPTYMQICGMDPLRDEGLLYARLLRERNVETKVDIYPGLPHGFVQSFPQLQKEEAKWDADMRAGLEWILGFAKTE